jgi:hypothetical protein
MHKYMHSSDHCAFDLLLLWFTVKELYCDRYAIGGLAGGESKDSFWRVVAQCTAALPEDKPRYVMVQIPFIISTYILQTSQILVNWVVIFIFFHVTIFSHVFPGCWLSTGYCGLQCFRCWHVWLCLSYSYCSLWHSSCTWGDSFLWT